MFIDEAEIELIAGHGGPGRVSFHKPPVKGPDGGNGGKGADILLQSSDSVSTLEYLGQGNIDSLRHCLLNAEKTYSALSRPNRAFLV